MARTSNQCGAVSGGMLAINLLTGRSSPEDPIDRNYALIQEFLNAFEEEFGSTNCQALIECDLATDEGQTKFRDQDKIDLCYQFVEETTRLVLNLVEP
jgi:C_GCAxxG_C_C family probable redox protein